MLLVSGGDALYLCHWMRQCGLADMLPSLEDTVWVGLSGGSMVMTPRIGEAFMGWSRPPATIVHSVSSTSRSTRTSTTGSARNTMANAEKWAATLDCPAYAIDDDTAIRVIDGTVDVISEGQWRLFPRADGEPATTPDHGEHRSR